MISVVLPSYNRATELKAAIKSVVDQSFDDWELLVVDDGSNDSTKEVAHDFKDSRIKYFYKENGGASQARNFGVNKALGKWIVYLDSDDTFAENALETLANQVKKSPEAKFAISRSKRILELYENGKLVEQIDNSDNMSKYFSVTDIFDRKAGFSSTGIAHEKSVFNEGISWNEKLPYMEDWEILLSLGNKYPDGFLFIPDILQNYTQKFGSSNIVSGSTYSSVADAFEQIYELHKDDNFMKNQSWYPSKVNKWRKRQKEFEKGNRVAYKYHNFTGRGLDFNE